MLKHKKEGLKSNRCCVFCVFRCCCCCGFHCSATFILAMHSLLLPKIAQFICTIIHNEAKIKLNDKQFSKVIIQPFYWLTWKSPSNWFDSFDIKLLFKVQVLKCLCWRFRLECFRLFIMLFKRFNDDVSGSNTGKSIWSLPWLPPSSSSLSSPSELALVTRAQNR